MCCLGTIVLGKANIVDIEYSYLLKAFDKVPHWSKKTAE